MSGIAGYIVTVLGEPLTLGDYDDTPKGGVLVFSSRPAMVFSTRLRALAAIRRTLKYSEANAALRWPRGHRIWALSPEPKARPTRG